LLLVDRKNFRYKKSLYCVSLWNVPVLGASVASFKMKLAVCGIVEEGCKNAFGSDGCDAMVCISANESGDRAEEARS